MHFIYFTFCRSYFIKSHKFFKENFNYSSDIFWLPDTFGYSAQLPQIIKIMGMKYFFTQKLSWNNINRVSYIYNIFISIFKIILIFFLLLLNIYI